MGRVGLVGQVGQAAFATSLTSPTRPTSARRSPTAQTPKEISLRHGGRDVSAFPPIVGRYGPMRHMVIRICAAMVLACAATTDGFSQPARAIDGPPAPIPPEVITRDGSGKATVRAIKLTTPLTVDGKLDEEVYAREKSFGGFLQVVPKYGEVETERTEVWVTYDSRNIYISCRCWDSAPPDKWIANELRRDTNQLRQNDQIGVSFDTFYDRRSGFLFYTNPLGARADYSVIDEGGSNTDWNPVWSSKTGRFDGGWTVEMAIPFKSLRYRSGPDQMWGLQLRRSVRRKNEWTYLTPVPQILAGPQAFNRISASGTLVGLDLPPAGKNLELKPYAISRLTTDRLRNPPLRNDLAGDLGGDVKYGLTANLTADFTYNTDFAQVEIDEQQVNLTRFSLFFPEKREFFLEGRGLFDFARGGITGGGASQASSNTIQPYLFYSRRIGLNNGRIVAIDGGGRLTGKVGKYGIGAMNIQTDDEPVSLTRPTNFSVVRVKRDVLRRSSIGAMVTNRSRAASGRGSNQAYGVDAAFSFFQNVGLGAYYAATETDGVTRDAASYQAIGEYGGDRYGGHLEYLKVGAGFNPEVGFIARTNFRRTYGTARFSPRPKSIRAVRKFTYQGNFDRFVNGAGDLETRIETGLFNTEFENSDVLAVNVTRDYELLLRPATILGVTIPTGGHQFTNALVTYALGAQRPVSGTVSLQTGNFYNGTLTAVGYSAARVSVLKQFSLEPTISINRVEVPGATVTTRLFRTRVDYGFTPLMFASGLLQYTSSDRAFSSNLRFRWEYRPGSELFVVYTDERDQTDPRVALPTQVIGLKNRAFVVKVNRLLRF